MSFFSGFINQTPNYVEDKFENMTDSQLYDQFKSENWTKLTKNEVKIDLLQEIENREAKAHGREPALVQETNGNLYGSYNNGTYVISINLNVDNQYQILDSIIHESTHVNQYRSNYQNELFSQEDKMLIRIEDMISVNGKDSHYNYYHNLYETMTSELDSNNRALEALLDKIEVYKYDKVYTEYLIDRNEYYEKVNNMIAELSNEKRNAILATAEAGYIRGELDYADYFSIKTNLNNSDKIDSFELEAMKLKEDITNTFIMSIKQEKSLNENDKDSKNILSNREVNDGILSQEITASEVESIENDEFNRLNMLNIENNNYTEIQYFENNEMLEAGSNTDSSLIIDDLNESSNNHDDEMVSYIIDDLDNVFMGESDVSSSNDMRVE